MQLDLLHESRVIAHGVLVLSVVCPSGAGQEPAACAAMLATTPEDASRLHAVEASSSILVLDDTAEGPLYLTMNDHVAHFDEHSGEVEVAIAHARS